VVGTPLHCPRLIERDAELGALVRFAAAAAGGTPSIVFVSGEAGMGKTRLLDELRAQLQRRAAVAAVACPAFAPASLGPIYSLLDALAPEPASADPPSGNRSPEAGQFQVFARLLDGLRAAAARKPVVATIDDAHWADSATLEFLKFAARALVDERLMLVVAYRSEDVGTSAGLERVVAQIARSPLACSVTLQALSGEGVAEFIEATVGDAAPPDAPSLRRVRERCEGNPLFVEELLKSALESGTRSGLLRGDRVEVRPLAPAKTSNRPPRGRGVRDRKTATKAR
jgi:predicted ATPase